MEAPRCAIYWCIALLVKCVFAFSPNPPRQDSLMEPIFTWPIQLGADGEPMANDQQQSQTYPSYFSGMEGHYENCSFAPGQQAAYTPYQSSLQYVNYNPACLRRGYSTDGETMDVSSMPSYNYVPAADATPNASVPSQDNAQYYVAVPTHGMAPESNTYQTPVYAQSYPPPATGRMGSATHRTSLRSYNTTRPAAVSTYPAYHNQAQPPAMASPPAYSTAFSVAPNLRTPTANLNTYALPTMEDLLRSPLIPPVGCFSAPLFDVKPLPFQQHAGAGGERSQDTSWHRTLHYNATYLSTLPAPGSIAIPHREAYCGIYLKLLSYISSAPAHIHTLPHTYEWHALCTLMDSHSFCWEHPATTRILALMLALDTVWQLPEWFHERVARAVSEAFIAEFIAISFIFGRKTQFMNALPILAALRPGALIHAAQHACNTVREYIPQEVMDARIRACLTETVSNLTVSSTGRTLNMQGTPLSSGAQMVSSTHVAAWWVFATVKLVFKTANGTSSQASPAQLLAFLDADLASCPRALRSQLVAECPPHTWHFLLPIAAEHAGWCAAQAATAQPAADSAVQHAQTTPLTPLHNIAKQIGDLVPLAYAPHTIEHLLRCCTAASSAETAQPRADTAFLQSFLIALLNNLQAANKIAPCWFPSVLVALLRMRLSAALVDLLYNAPASCLLAVPSDIASALGEHLQNTWPPDGDICETHYEAVMEFLYYLTHMDNTNAVVQRFASVSMVAPLHTRHMHVCLLSQPSALPAVCRYFFCRAVLALAEYVIYVDRGGCPESRADSEKSSGGLFQNTETLFRNTVAVDYAQGEAVAIHCNAFSTTRSAFILKYLLLHPHLAEIIKGTPQAYSAQGTGTALPSCQETAGAGGYPSTHTPYTSEAEAAADAPAYAALLWFIEMRHIAQISTPGFNSTGMDMCIQHVPSIVPPLKRYEHLAALLAIPCVRDVITSRLAAAASWDCAQKWLFKAIVALSYEILDAFVPNALADSEQQSGDSVLRPRTGSVLHASVKLLNTLSPIILFVVSNPAMRVYIQACSPTDMHFCLGATVLHKLVVAMRKKYVRPFLKALGVWVSNTRASEKCLQSEGACREILARIEDSESDSDINYLRAMCMAKLPR